MKEPRRPQQPLPVRERQEVQEVLRKVTLLELLWGSELGILTFPVGAGTELIPAAEVEKLGFVEPIQEAEAERGTGTDGPRS